LKKRLSQALKAHQSVIGGGEKKKKSRMRHEIVEERSTERVIGKRGSIRRNCGLTRRKKDKTMDGIELL